MSKTDDIVALDQLQNRYLTLMDSRRFDDLMELFVDDIEVDASGAIGEVWRGKEEVRAKYEAVTADSRGNAHLTMNGVVDVAADTAIATRYLLSVWWNRSPDQVFFGTFGTYEFSFVRLGDDWKIRRVTARSVFKEGLRSVFEERP